MLRPEFSARTATAATGAGFERIALPLAPTGGVRFSALMNDVRSEVNAFIEHGSPAAALSASGQAYRMRTQAALPVQPALSALSALPALRALGTIGALESTAPTAVAPARATITGTGAHQQAFLAAISPWVNDAAERLGVAPEIVAAQAALESGWGQRPVRHPDGRDTHNLFGLKAGSSWQGNVAAALTTEFEDGVGMRRNEMFRSYPDYGSAFRDFTRLLLDNPRYQAALNAGNDARAYAQGLARGGYATDPAYADKLTRLAGQLQRTD